MDGKEPAELYDKAKEAADALVAKAAQIREITERLERLTEETPAWYAATRARVEARATLEQAEELRRALEGLGKKVRHADT